MSIIDSDDRARVFLVIFVKILCNNQSIKYYDIKIVFADVAGL